MSWPCMRGGGPPAPVCDCCACPLDQSTQSYGPGRLISGTTAIGQFLFDPGSKSVLVLCSWSIVNWVHLDWQSEHNRNNRYTTLS